MKTHICLIFSFCFLSEFDIFFSYSFIYGKKKIVISFAVIFFI
jgi:hypothetical protein